MKKDILMVLGLIGLVIMSFLLVAFMASKVYAENYITNYGYYDNLNEISAKDRIIPHVNNIFDFENGPNPDGDNPDPNGEFEISDGRFYIETKYKGGNGGTDADYIYLDEIIGKDGTNGKDGEKGDTGSLDQQTLNTLTQNISTNNVQSQNIENRLNELEKPEFNIEPRVQIYDSRNWNVSVEADFNINQGGKYERTNIEFTYKFGKDHAVKELEKMQKQIDLLMSTIKESNIEVVPNGVNSWTIKKKF